MRQLTPLLFLAACANEPDIRRAEETQDPATMQRFVDAVHMEELGPHLQKCAEEAEAFLSNVETDLNSRLSHLDGYVKPEHLVDGYALVATMDETPSRFQMTGELRDQLRQGFFSICLNHRVPGFNHCQMVPTQFVERKNAMGQWVPSDRTMEMSIWRMGLDQEWDEGFEDMRQGSKELWAAIPRNPEFDARCAVDASLSLVVGPQSQ